MDPSKRIKNKILLNSYLCKMLGIITDQEYHTILNKISSHEYYL
ncbi:hypothetical protein [Neobacillus endophyticus]|nr:hypothetical protein [Neobacillus endophyticus]